MILVKNKNIKWKLKLILFTICGFLIIFFSIINNCSSTNSQLHNKVAIKIPPPPSGSRHYYLGFNPWPYAATVEAVDWTYNSINENGDILAHHIEEGVPWSEAENGKPFADDFENSLKMRIEKTSADKKIFLSLNSINVARNGLALYRGKAINMELPEQWKSVKLNSQQVKLVYLKYILRMIEIFKPQYLAIGIEVNLLIRNTPALWPQYLDLHRNIYSEIKKRHPKLKIMATVDANPLLEGYTDEDNYKAQIKGLQELLPYVDMLGVSVHPVMSKYHADFLPPDIFDKIFTFTKKPIAITESSYPAQIWTIKVNGMKFDFNGSEVKQNNFLLTMLNAAEKYRSPFVINFTIRDYDELWKSIGSPDAALPWRDTGFYDADGSPRLALRTWKKALALPLH